MRTILVINSKGGCGKTTVTINLASYYAANRARAAIMDYDPQGSCLNWLRVRGAQAPRIHGANAAPQRGTLIRSLQMSVPAGTDVLIIDAPAGVKGLLLQEIVRRADTVLIPVAPSSIDIHATADFVRDLLLVGRVRANNTRVAVLANRVRSSMPVYDPLERFLTSLSLPLLTRISDSDVYIKAAETGLGVFEMDTQESAAARDEFRPVIDWLDHSSGVRRPGADGRVVDISGGRKLFAV